jgi:hypothetical protein
MTTTAVTSVGSLPRIDRARAWLETRDNAEEVLILGASLGAANELTRSLVKTRGAAFGWHRLTLAQLAANIASPVLTERGLASISQIGAEATVARLLHRLRIERRLGRFQPIAHTPGFPRAITAVLTELRLAQLSSEALATAAPDVSMLLAAYEAELAELALADWPEILSLAAEGVLSHRLSGLPVLMLDIPIGSEAELRFLRALTVRAPETLATVPAADKLLLTRVRDDLHWPIEDLDLRFAPVPQPRRASVAVSARRATSVRCDRQHRVKTLRPPSSASGLMALLQSTPRARPLPEARLPWRGLAPALIPRPQRTRQMGIGGDEVAGGTGIGSAGGS